MNANATKWVAALRSGKFPQGKNYLKVDGKYCCLGVACELAVTAGLPITVGSETTSTEPQRDFAVFGGERFYLPKSVQDWLGLKSKFGSFSLTGEQGDDLTELNDKGKTFEEIANVIEEKESVLFA